MFPKVVQVIPMKDYSVYVYFEDGKIVCYDMSQMLEKEVFQPLKDIDIFRDKSQCFSTKKREVEKRRKRLFF